VHDGPGADSTTITQAGEVRSARIESLRAIAALGVMEGHIFGQAHLWGPTVKEGLRHRVLLGGGFGVYLFFVLSGYLLYWPFARRALAGDGALSLGRYARNRALRILPLYFVVLVTLMVAVEGGGSLDRWWRFALFAENFSTRTFASVDGAMWSLVVELHFYALLPLIAFGVHRLARGSLKRAAGCLAVLGLAAFGLRLATFQLAAAPDPLLRYSIPSLFGFFATGMLLALLRLEWERRPPRRLKGWLGHSDVWLAAAAGVWLVIFWRYDLEPLAAVACFLMIGACVLPLRAGRLMSVLQWRVLAGIGVISYSLYLWHLPIVLNLAETSWAPKTFLPMLVLVGGLCIVVAMASYRLVEAPFLGLRRRWAGSAPGPQKSPLPTPTSAGLQ